MVGTSLDRCHLWDSEPFLTQGAIVKPRISAPLVKRSNKSVATRTFAAIVRKKFANFASVKDKNILDTSDQIFDLSFAKLTRVTKICLNIKIISFEEYVVHLISS